MKLFQFINSLVLRFTRRSDCSIVANSRYFDADWYREQTGIDNKTDPVVHFLDHGAEYSPGKNFDSIWYLEQYPDVAAAGFNPLIHFLKYGREERRLPNQIYSPFWDMHLWSGLDQVMVPQLRALISNPDTSDNEKKYAAWVLARWYAWKGDWKTVHDLLWTYQDLVNPFPYHLGPVILALESALRCGENDDAQTVLTQCLAHKPKQPDLCLAQANLFTNMGNIELSLSWLNHPLNDAGLSPIKLNSPDNGFGLDNLFVEVDSSLSVSKVPIVSVIVPAYNAESTITAALQSLFNQTWRELEIIIIDDASTDGTWEHLQVLKNESPGDISLKLMRNDANQGAYASRNRGLAEAGGEFITCHDADDWSHPQKISSQVSALINNSKLKASVSHWVRVTPDMHFHRWRIDEGLIDRNVSSLMFRREVFGELGFWDRVSIAADTEFYYRIICRYGEAAIEEVFPGIPLSFGRSSPESLSQHSATHEVSQYYGIRKDYMDAAHNWHKSHSGDLYLDETPAHRPFYAPVQIRHDSIDNQLYEPFDALLASGLFDSVWYRYRYPDLLDRLLDPLQHFWTQGINEGRDPGPQFSCTGYAQYYGLGRDENPILHYLDEGKARGLSPLPVFEGERVYKEGNKTILLLGHQSIQQTFGAERCLTDILQAMDSAGLNVVVCLPGVGNEEYFQELRNSSLAVAVLPYGWWMEHRPACEHSVQYIVGLIESYEIDQVYLNTSVLYEPALAARRAGVPVVTHVHELPEDDPELCKVLNSDPQGVVSHVVEQADRVIANSQFVADYLEQSVSETRVDAESSGLKISVVPNTVDMEPLLALPVSSAIAGETTVLTLGMVSSNLPKKGLHDFVEVARALEEKAAHVRCVLFGPQNRYVDNILSDNSTKTLPANLSFEGYVADPVQALAQLDVVVNLSHCQETFGRTVLEAMAAGRPTICYDRGALPELVVNGETGFLVPYQDIKLVVERVLQLIEDASIVTKMGLAGRKRAVASYGCDRFNGALVKAINE